MGDCVFCGQPSGFLRRQHKACREIHDRATINIPDFFVKALGSPIGASRFRELTEKIAGENFVPEKEFRQLAISGLQKMIDAAFSVGMTMEEDQRISTMCNAFEIRENDLGSAGIRLAKAQILRHLGEGEFPKKTHVDEVPINLEHEESLIWLFNGVTYYTTRTRDSIRWLFTWYFNPSDEGRLLSRWRFQRGANQNAILV